MRWFLGRPPYGLKGEPLVQIEAFGLIFATPPHGWPWIQRWEPRVSPWSFEVRLPGQRHLVIRSNHLVIP